MSLYYPEGWRIDTPQNRNAMLSYSTLADACRDGQILEGRAIICDSAHNLMVDLGCMKGIIPREDSAIGIREGTVRDIAIISRVNRPVCFVIAGFQKKRTAPSLPYYPAGWLRKNVRRNIFPTYRPAT